MFIWTIGDIINVVMGLLLVIALLIIMFNYD